jgi:hypothetical protein
MNVSAATRVPRRSTWSLPTAYLVTLLPIIGATVSAWIELSTPGESAWWIVAGAWFVASPIVAAAATERAGGSRSVRLLVVLTLIAMLEAIWIRNVPVPTHPILYMGGSSPRTGAAIAMLTGVAWWVASDRSIHWLRRDQPVIALVFGASALTMLSFVAFVVGMLVP